MRTENIKVSCKIISEYLRRMKNELSAHKKLPVELFIVINSAQRAIEKENHKIRRSVWRKKYLRAANIKPLVFASYTTTSSGGLNVSRKR